jgi:cation:H+ antiporter
MSISNIAILLGGLLTLVFSGEVLVRSASRVAAHLGVSPLVIGLTIVAFGTGSPELAVSIEASLRGEPGLALGNVLGGNICNTLLILGTCALIAPVTLHINLIKMETPFIALVSFTVLLMCTDLQIDRTEGLLLLSLLILYILVLLKRSSKESGEVQDQYAREYGTSQNEYNMWYQALGILCALAGLSLGSHLVVKAASHIAAQLGLSDFIIGITIVALGTSLPELITSVSAMLAGERDLAVGNVIGSNLFNVLMVLGTSALLTPLEVGQETLAFDLPVFVISAILCVPIFFDKKIDRREGTLMVVSYLCYITYSVFQGLNHPSTPLVALCSLALLAPCLCNVGMQFISPAPKD